MKTRYALTLLAGASLLALATPAQAQSGYAGQPYGGQTYGQNSYGSPSQSGYGSSTSGTAYGAPRQAPSYSYGSSGIPNWGGFYAGINVGGVWGDFSGRNGSHVGPTGDDADVTYGIQGGYNWQFDRWVVGGEADLESTDLEHKNDASAFKEYWTSTYRVRGGYAIDKWLPFATLGLGLTNADSEAGGGSVNNTHVGFVVGAGFDYAIMDNLSWRTEYLHVDVPEESDTIGGVPYNGGSGNNIIRIGANYRFH